MTDAVYTPPSVLSKNLVESEYNRQRLFPDPKDELYVHLSDIRLFLDNYTSESFERLLDFGCGGSPYRALFKANEYIRADYVDCGHIDFAINADGKIDMPGGSCDGVLSTQVLEHVFSPAAYLSEAFRLLRPGGKLILTTPGIWEDHGCPYDFRRWTYDGLARDVEAVGFRVTRIARLTTGARAILFMFSKIFYVLQDTPLSLSGLAFRILRHSRFAVRESRHKWMDRQFADNRIVYGAAPQHTMYLALGLEGVKP
jgi:SAM-dependent methyltransferase